MPLTISESFPILRGYEGLNIGHGTQISQYGTRTPYTKRAPYTPYGYNRSNGCSFLTSIHLRPCTVWRNYTNSECLRDFGSNFGEIGPRAHFSGVPNSSTPKSQNHSYLTHFSDTVQGLGLVLVRNDQPFDLPCPYG